MAVVRVYHSGVALVMEDYLIENIKEEGWMTRMTRVDRILPQLP